MKRKILIIAGEVSGDQHAADLVGELKKFDGEIEFAGIGGDRLAAEGVHLHYHLSQLAVLGFSEIVKHLPFISKVLKHMKQELKGGVQAVILVDYPGFNLRVARLAREAGVPVIYYISPQLWAWGEKRVEKMRRYVDLLLVLFRFEVEFYRRHGITAHFAGHPLIDQIPAEADSAEFRRAHDLPPDVPILGLFPGSREMEVRKLLPVMIAAAETVQSRHACIPVIARVSHLPAALYEDALSGRTAIPMVENRSHLLMRHAHVALVASGTATLELGYLQTPMVVLYTVSPFTYWLGKRLIKINNIALANIVAGKTVVPEFIQQQVTVEPVSAAISRYFSDERYYQSVREQLGAVRQALGEPGASQRAAEKIWAFLK